MKVLPTLLCGGTEKQAFALTHSLQARGYEMEFACLRRCGPFVGELEARGIPVTEYSIPSFRSVRGLTQQVKFARSLTRRGIQIVHSYNFYGNVFAVPPARAARTPVVVASIRDRGAYLTAHQRRVQRYACRLADCVLVNAAAVKEWLVADGYNPSTIVVISNGIDTRQFQPPPDRTWLHQQLELPPTSPLVAVVSRLVRLKGLDYFLEAAAMVAHRFPHARFVLVGEPNPSQYEYLQELRDLSRRLAIADRVIFTGLRRDVPEILGSIGVAVVPSLNEALPNSMLEAMAAGCPVVASRVGGVPEALTDGQNGLLVPPADAAALANAISALLDDRDLASRLGCAARASVTRHFSIERMVASTERLYEELLARKGTLPLASAA